METFWLCFVPLFVAVDVVGVLPMYLNLTEGFSASEKRRTLVQSVLTAVGVAIGFLFLGQSVFRLLGVTIPDFMIAGGVLLFAFAMSDLLSVEKLQRRVDAESVGAVPIGVPLTVGPAVLTTIILLANQHGRLRNTHDLQDRQSHPCGNRRDDDTARSVGRVARPARLNATSN